MRAGAPSVACEAMQNDPEAASEWLARLRDLNEAIAAFGEPLMGNLCYEHEQPDYAEAPPAAILREKRDRLRSALSDRRCLLEVGVNGGHSAFVALTSNPNLELHGVDVCVHAYARHAAQWLCDEFGDRFVFHPGDCRKVLPRLAQRGLRYDAFHLDGAKFTYYEDTLNAACMIDGRHAVIIMDDSNRADVQGTWVRLTQAGVVRSMASFPEMSEHARYRNAIGEVVALPPLCRGCLLAVERARVALRPHAIPRAVVRALKSAPPTTVLRRQGE